MAPAPKLGMSAGGEVYSAMITPVVPVPVFPTVTPAVAFTTVSPGVSAGSSTTVPVAMPVQGSKSTLSETVSPKPLRLVAWYGPEASPHQLSVASRLPVPSLRTPYAALPTISLKLTVIPTADVVENKCNPQATLFVMSLPLTVMALCVAVPLPVLT